jgi:hypothetical protein
MKFAELERLFVKISQKHRFPGVLLGCRLEVQYSPRLIFVQSGENYRQIWPWGAQTAGDALRASPAVEGPQAKIRRYLASDGCKFRPGEAHVSSGESRAFLNSK